MIDISYDDFIWGDKFKNLSNCTFVKIDDAFKYLKINNVHKLITHNGDYPVDNRYNEILNNVKYWFAQNVFNTNTKIIPIPIGLENDYVTNSVEKKKILFEYRNKNIEIQKLLYINHNIGTNPIERSIPYKLYTTNQYITVESCSGFDNQHNYYAKIKQHTFTLSPPGNGLDCHRTWEILYCDRYPILKNIGRLKDLYKDLPVVFIDKYEELTEEFLKNKQIEFNNKTFNYEKIKFNYWQKLIQNYTGN
jgi:hypothetical protein